MWKRLAGWSSAPVACAFLLSACGGGDEPRPQRPVADERPVEVAPAATVALTGCVEGAPAPDQYVLRNVRLETQDGVDAHRDLTTAGHGVTEGSWVRLDAGEQPEQLQTLLGQHVSLRGTVVDTGESTIGTAGTTGDETPASATTRAAGDEHYAERIKDEAGRIARESMADGLAALVRVTEVAATGQPCPMLRPGAQ